MPQAQFNLDNNLRGIEQAKSVRIKRFYKLDPVKTENFKKQVCIHYKQVNKSYKVAV